MKQYQELLIRNLSETIGKMVSVRASRRISTCAMANLMGIPEVAVNAIAKGAGIVQGEWIDEDSLGVFEDAYIRKLKAYFKRMMRNANEMGCDDLRTFISFCDTFKKPNIETSKICRWEDIDEDAILEQFRADIEEISSSEPLFEQFGDMPGCMISTGRIESRSLDSRFEIINVTNHSALIQNHRRGVLRAVTSSLVYRTRLRRCRKVGHREKEHKAFFITAHYYIYCREDKEDHHVDTIIESRPYWACLSINSTKMAA